MNLEKLKAIIADVLDMDENLIDMDTKKDEMEKWDSLAHLQLIGEIEAAYGIRIPFEEIIEIRAVGDFLKYIKE